MYKMHNGPLSFGTGSSNTANQLGGLLTKRWTSSYRYYTWAKESEKLEDLLVAGYIAWHGQVSRLRQALKSSELVKNQLIHPQDW